MGTHPIFESDFDCLTETRPKNDRTRNPDGDGNSHGGYDRSASDGDGSGGAAAVDGRHGPREAGSRARALVETAETVPRNEAQGKGRGSLLLSASALLMALVNWQLQQCESCA